MIEARTALRRPGISKQAVAVVLAVVAAFALGGAGGYAAKSLSLPTTSSSPHIVAGQSEASGSTWYFSTRAGGTQSLEGPPPAGTSDGATFREPSSGHGGPQS
jgi:hypothetical protein